MVIGGWLGFSFIIAAQCMVYALFLWCHGDCVKQVKKLPKYLVLGLFFGVVFDVVFGLYASTYTYDLGFTPQFLFLNGLLSFGLATAKVALLKKLPFVTFGLSCVFMGLLYEIANIFAGVWEWTFFTHSFYEYALIVFVAYPGFGLVTSLYLQLLRQEKFIIWRLK